MKIVKTFTHFPYPVLYTEIESKEILIQLVFKEDFPKLVGRKAKISIMFGTTDENDSVFNTLISGTSYIGGGSNPLRNESVILIGDDIYSEDTLEYLESSIKGDIIEASTWNQLLDHLINEFVEKIPPRLNLQEFPNPLNGANNSTINIYEFKIILD